MVNRPRSDAAVPTTGTSKLQNAKSEHGDDIEGAWSRQRRINMDLKFRARVERAIKRGRETPQRAVAGKKLPSTQAMLLAQDRTAGEGRAGKATRKSPRSSSKRSCGHLDSRW
jgi:hypothetical protein